MAEQAWFPFAFLVATFALILAVALVMRWLGLAIGRRMIQGRDHSADDPPMLPWRRKRWERERRLEKIRHAYSELNDIRSEYLSSLEGFADKMVNTAIRLTEVRARQETLNEKVLSALESHTCDEVDCSCFNEGYIIGYRAREQERRLDIPYREELRWSKK
jgi:hypothetical protein